MSIQKERVLNVAIILMSICAVATTSLAAYRSWRPTTPTAPPAAIETADWRSFASAGQRIGPRDAPVTIIEFSDFECRFCKSAAEVLKAAVRKYDGDVALLYRHFPLTRQHRFARAAAIASECAARQGRFEEYHDVLFEQDALLGTNWTELAVRAGIADTVTFAACLTDPAAQARVEEDAAAGRALGVTGTPTVLINQYRLQGGADPLIVDSIIRLALRKQ